MIEQFTPGLPQASQPAAGTHRDRHPVAEQDDQSSDRFEDLVSKAEERYAQNPNKNRAGGAFDKDGASGKDSVKISRPVEALPKVAFEFSAALRGLANPSQVDAQQVTSAADPSPDNPLQTRAKPVGFKDAVKAHDSADKGEQTGRQAEAALARLVEKTKQATQNAEAARAEMRAADNVQAADDQKPLTASDELGLLLGLTRDADAKSGRKPASADAVDKSHKPADDDKGIDAPAGKIDAHGGDPMLMTIDTRHGDDDRPSDDASNGDVVRVVSASGRGRAVDIEVPAVPGTQQQDGAKPAATPKIETATVLEARRYLGFVTETNGAALAAAVKSDPAWTEALQSAQRTDPVALASTVTEVNTLKLQMNPENLGSMVASLKLKGEELTVELRVNSVEAYHHLTADHDDLVKSLQDQGFSIDKVTVHLNATDRTDTGADRDMARQQGQAQRDGQAQREQSQRDGQGGQPGRNDGQRSQPHRTMPADADLAAGGGRADPGRPANIYL